MLAADAVSRSRCASSRNGRPAVDAERLERGPPAEEPLVVGADDRLGRIDEPSARHRERENGHVSAASGTREPIASSNSATDQLDELAVRGAGSSLQKIALPGDERSAPASRAARAVSRLIPPSTWTRTLRGQQRAQPGDPLERLRHERLPRVPGVNRHAEHEIHSFGSRDRVLDRRLGVECDADAEPERPRRATARAGSSQTSTWKVTLSPPAFAIASKCSSGSATIRWQSSRAPHPRTSGEIEASTIGPIVISGMKWPSPTSKWKTFAPAPRERVELLAEPREVGRVDRRLDLDRVCPLGPAHRAAT